NAALLSNTDGFNNTATGFQALRLNTGSGNTAVGSLALSSNTTAGDNTAMGSSALVSNTTGNSNTATGAFALEHNTTGNFNTATGLAALEGNTTGTSNTADGIAALSSNTTGIQNTAVGDHALASNVSNFNTAVGVNALSNSNGINADENTAVGFEAISASTLARQNTAVGYQALNTVTSGGDNTAVGDSAGFGLTTGSFNIYIDSTPAAGSEASTIRIGHPLGLFGGQTRAFIAGISGVNEGGTISAVFINTNGQLGTQPPSSSRRFKKEIQPMDKASEAILALKPVTFHYKSDPAGAGPQFGLIAEEVGAVNPDLVVRDDKGEIYTVRYDAVNAMLLNEFLKEHRTVQNLKSAAAKQEATIARQQKQIEALSAGL